MISEHFEAVQARIEEAAGLAGNVYDTLRQSPSGGLTRAQYVILYRSGPRVGSDRLASVATMSSVLTFDVDVRAVGTSPENVTRVTEKVLEQLAGHRLSVAGRSCAPMTVEESGRVLTDTSVKDFLYYSDLSFELISEPA